MSTIVATNIQDRVSSISVPIVAVINQRTNYGLVPSNNSGDATNDIDFTAGKCWDTTGTNYITVAAMTKRADATWAAGTNQGMIDTGAFAADTCYYFWAIYKDSDGTGDIIMSLADDWASVNKTLITGYTTGQLIHALPSVAGSIMWPAVTVIEDEVSYAFAATEVSNYTSMVNNVTSVFTVTVPKLCLGHFSAYLHGGTAGSAMSCALCTTDRVGLGPGYYMAYLATNTAGLTHIGGANDVQVDASSQIGLAVGWNSGGSETVIIYSNGFTFNRRFAGT